MYNIHLQTNLIPTNYKHILILINLHMQTWVQMIPSKFYTICSNRVITLKAKPAAPANLYSNLYTHLFKPLSIKLYQHHIPYSLTALL